MELLAGIGDACKEKKGLWKKKKKRMGNIVSPACEERYGTHSKKKEITERVLSLWGMAKMVWRGASEMTHRATVMYGKGNSMAQRVFAIMGVSRVRVLVTPSRGLNLPVSSGLYSTTQAREWSLLYPGTSTSCFSEFKERSLLPSQRFQAPVSLEASCYVAPKSGCWNIKW